MSLKSGDLRHKIIIQNRSLAQNPDNGGIAHVWVNIAEVFASITPLSARDFIAASAVQSEVTARIVIRHRKDVIAGMRILHRDKIYTIKGVLADAESGLEYLTLPVGEGVKNE